MSLYPDPNAPYGTCDHCHAVMQTEADARRHMETTLEAAEWIDGQKRGHRIHIENPPRVDRVRRRVEEVVEYCIEDDHDLDIASMTITPGLFAAGDAVERLTEIVEAGEMSHAEVAAHLRSWPDFLDAWQEAHEGEDLGPDPVHPDQLDLLDTLEEATR